MALRSRADGGCTPRRIYIVRSVSSRFSITSSRERELGIGAVKERQFFTIYPGCLTPILALFFLIHLPIFFAQFMLAALAKLGLSARRHSSSSRPSSWEVPSIFRSSDCRGAKKLFPIGSSCLDFNWFVSLPRIRRSHVTIAVNVGGCIIPSTLAIYEGLLVAQHESRALVELIIVTALGRRTVQRSGPRIERIGGQTMFL